MMFDVSNLISHSDLLDPGQTREIEYYINEYNHWLIGCRLPQVHPIVRTFYFILLEDATLEYMYKINGLINYICV